MDNNLFLILLFLSIILFIGFITASVILIRQRRSVKEVERIINEEKEKIEENLEETTEDSDISFDIIVNTSRDLMDLIISLVRIELVIFAREDFLLPSQDKKKIKVNYDEAIKTISTNVFEAFKDSIYVNSNHVFTSDFLFRFIQNITVIEYLNHLNNMNNSAPIMEFS